MERIPTYIWRLDKEIGGGIPKGSVILLQGEYGTYKTSLSYYILYRNAKESGRESIFVTTELTKDRLKRHLESMKIFPEEVDPLVKIVDIASMKKRERKILPMWIETIAERIRSFEGVQLLVVDNINLLDYIEDPLERRNAIFEFFEMLRDHSLTSIVISDIYRQEDRTDYELLADGVWKSKKVMINPSEYQVNIGIEKMLYTRHSFSYYTLVFEEGNFQLTKVMREEYKY